MKVEELELAGVKRITPQVFGDERGFFLETFRRQRYADAGLPTDFVQDNLSCSQAGVLRGLHFQHPQAQGKLVMVPQGAVLDVAVDLRPGSPTFGRHLSCHLDGETKQQLWIPPGFAHGFQVLEDDTLFLYKCTAAYAPEHEHTLAYDDPALGIAWAEGPLQVSPKDREGRSLAEVRRLVEG